MNEASQPEDRRPEGRVVVGPDSTRDDAEARVSRSRPERAKIEDRRRLRAAAVYEIVRTEGEEELARPTASLVWSGIAAGISIGLSVVAEGLLRAHLPPADWRPLVDNFGYATGFLVVILGRQQLFTENTITAVLPLMADKRWCTLRKVLRLWAIVFLANMAGTLICGAALSSGLFFPADAEAAFREIATHLNALAAHEIFFRGIVAGFIVAAIVWTLPSAGAAAFMIVTALTYLIALGDLSHVIAGAVETYMLAFDGTLAWSEAVLGFVLPALAGNIIGGTILFALISYAQVRREIES